jgi:hypothetical protein
MKLAEILLRAWKLRVWVAIGGLVAVAAAVASLTLFKSTVYASASTQMLVDAPRSALADSRTDLTGFTVRAVVYARLMTTPEALDYIGHAAGIPGNLIAASGPTELDGPNAVHAPTAVRGGQVISPTASYKLNFLQNPELPTVDVYADAPTVKQAIALANGAVKGFGTYISGLEDQTGVPAAQRVEVRELGSATGGVVDPSSTKTIAVLVFVAVFAVWFMLVLSAQNVREQMRLAKLREASEVAVAAAASEAEYDVPEPQIYANGAELNGVAPEGTAIGKAGQRRNGTAKKEVGGRARVSP